MHAERKITGLSDYHSFTPHPSLSPYSQTELRRNEYTRFTWAGGTFFPVVLLCQFLFWWEIGFGFTYYYVLRVSYSCGVVFVFLVLAGNSFWCYAHT